MRVYRVTVTSPSSAHRITSAEKLAKALEARRQGSTLDECAQLAGYSSKQAVSRALLRHYRALTKENFAQAALARAEEMERLDYLLQSVWPLVDPESPAESVDTADRLRAVDRVIKIIRVRSHLLGLNQPKRRTVERQSAGDFDLARLGPAEIDQLHSLLRKAQTASPS